MARVFWVLVLVPVLWGCSDSSSSTERIVEQNPRQKLETNLQEANLYCDSSAACPESVGYILANIGERHIGQCTGWLVAPDVVATNSHCIPDEMKSGAVDCAGNIGIKFPETNGRDGEILLCSQLLHFSKIVNSKEEEGYITRPDYAYFRLERATARKPYRFERTGIEDGQPLQLFSVDPMASSTPLVGRLIRRTCTAHKNSAIIPEDTHSLSDVAAVFGENCDARQGNSGSPVLNMNGDAIGWLHGGILAGTDVNARIPYEKREGRLLRPAFLTNAACTIELPSVPQLGGPGGACAPENLRKLKEANDIGKRAGRQAKDALAGGYADWVRKQTNLFKFRSWAKLSKSELGEEEVILKGSVACVIPMSRRGAPTSEAPYLVGGSPEKATQTVQWPAFRVSRKLDPYWRVIVRVTEAPAWIGNFSSTFSFETANPAMTLEKKVGYSESSQPTYLCTDAELLADSELELN